MPCYHPLTGWRARKPGPSGKTPIVFRKEDSNGTEVKLPCGQCIGCRLEYSRQWAVRLMHENQLHGSSCFVTLTYRPGNLPPYGTLVKKHFQDFMKRLRFHFPHRKIRYFHCGEYGENFGRPHYHAILYGIAFVDQLFYKIAPDGSRLHTSAILDRIWTHGYCVIGNVTFESAAYVARYILKKVTGADAKHAYVVCDPETGEIPVLPDGSFPVRQPEYVTMSRGGRTGKGIAHGWFQKFSSDVYPLDEVVTRGVSCRPPKYYDAQYELNGGDLDSLKAARRAALLRFSANCTDERLRVREICTRARISVLRRTVD